MGKKRKKESSSSSASSESEPVPKTKDLPKMGSVPSAKAATGPRFNVADSDSDDGAPKTAGISTVTAADAFNKKQWELMEQLKVDYRKQTDKKAKKEEKHRKKEEKKEQKKEKKRAKKFAEEEEAAAEEAAAEKARAVEAKMIAAKAARKAEQEAVAAAKKIGPSVPGRADKPVGVVQYSSDLQIGQSHGGGAGAGV